MQYMLMFTETEADRAKSKDPVKSADYWAGWNVFVDAIMKSGVVISGNALQHPELATTVRVRDGKRIVQDGPFADSKEQLSGYFIIDVPDLDTALDWAAKVPCAHYAAVEVRPVMPPMNPPKA
jgi:hypothetical protein